MPGKRLAKNVYQRSAPRIADRDRYPRCGWDKEIWRLFSVFWAP